MNMLLVDPISASKLKEVDMYRKAPSNILQIYDFETFLSTDKFSKEKKQEYFYERLDILKYIESICIYLLEIYSFIDDNPDMTKCVRAIKYLNIVQSYNFNSRLKYQIQIYLTSLASLFPGEITISNDLEYCFRQLECRASCIPKQPDTSDPRGYLLSHDAKEASVSIMQSIERYMRIEIARHLTSNRLVSYNGWADWNPCFFVDNNIFNAFHFLFDPDDKAESALSGTYLAQDEIIKRINDFTVPLKSLLSAFLSSVTSEKIALSVIKIKNSKNIENYSFSPELREKIKHLIYLYKPFEQYLFLFLDQNRITINHDHLIWNGTTERLAHLFCFISSQEYSEKNKNITLKKKTSIPIKSISNNNTKRNNNPPRNRMSWVLIADIFGVPRKTLNDYSSRYDPTNKKEMEALYHYIDET